MWIKQYCKKNASRTRDGGRKTPPFRTNQTRRKFPQYRELRRIFWANTITVLHFSGGYSILFLLSTSYVPSTGKLRIPGFHESSSPYRFADLRCIDGILICPGKNGTYPAWRRLSSHCVAPVLSNGPKSRTATPIDRTETNWSAKMTIWMIFIRYLLRQNVFPQ